MSRQDRNDLIENRSEMAKSVLDVLMMAMENDSPPVPRVVNSVIWAATELLRIPEVVA